MFFQELTTPTLQTLCFSQIKNVEQRKYAIDILTMTIRLNVNCKNILCDKTIKKLFWLEKTNRLGLEFSLLLVKKSGYIKIYIQKKKTAHIVIQFANYEKTHIQSIFYNNDCNENWVKILLDEFDNNIVEYIKNGFSNKLKDLRTFIQKNMNNKKYDFHAHIDIPGYICML